MRSLFCFVPGLTSLVFPLYLLRSFFLVFYVNQSHKRFFGLYKDSMACKGRIFDVATIAVTTLPKERATRLVRYMNAAHAAGYVGLVSTS